MIKITNKIDCCGCNACGDICPNQSISFHSDNEGFWYPEVDKTTCVECGLCEKVCPIININTLKKNDLAEPECYVAENKNISVVFSSTSGGLFSALAEATYRQEGFVGGAVFNEDFSVKQIISNNREDLPRIRGSKYIQSDFSGFYIKVRNILNKGEKVLVCGCPCQMAALRSFLRKDYDNLIIVDFICAAIGSPKVFNNYLKTFEARYGAPVVHARAKSKEYGWRNLTQKVTLANGKNIFETTGESVWTNRFNKDGLFHRPSCHNCKFKGLPRISDLTIADFWGIENLKLDSITDKDLGLSIVMCNSKKGRAYFEVIKNKINYQQVSFDSLTKNNRAIYHSTRQEPVDRTAFYRDLDTMSIHDAVAKYYPVQTTLKSRLRGLLKQMYIVVNGVIHNTRLRPKPLWQFFKYNTLSEVIKGNIFFPTPYCIIHNEGKIIIRGIFVLGEKKIRSSKVETRLWVEENGVFETTGPVVVGYGTDIQVFKNAHFTFGGNSNINSSAIIICGERIFLGEESRIGRGVLIRDNNGHHYLDIPGYKTSKPIITEDHIWYGEGATIMQGVKIGQGAVISAKSFVTSNIPAHSIVSGNPAKVVQENIRWKF